MTAPNQQTTPQEVEAFHRRDDLDVSDLAHHHTLGARPTQASSGNHDHLGRNSDLLEGYLRIKDAAYSPPTVTGSRGGNAALTSLLTTLHNLGIITDATTA